MPPAAFPIDACCRSCGYALRELSREVCPECGSAFDRADPQTFDSVTLNAQLSSGLQQRRDRFGPPGAATTGLVAVLVALGIAGQLWTTLWFGARFCTVGLVWLIIAALGVDYFIWWNREARALRGEAVPGGPRFIAARRRRRVHGFMLAVVLINLAYPWLVATLVLCSLSPLNAAAKLNLAGLPRNEGEQWIGLLHVRKIYRGWTGVVHFDVSLLGDRSFILLHVGKVVTGGETRDAWPLPAPNWYVIPYDWRGGL